MELLERWREAGDIEARRELVERMLPFVRHVALRYAGRGQDLDDLIQVGSVGLLKAIDRFDPARGVRLTTFAEPNVAGEIKRFFRDHGWTVRPPRNLQEMYAKVGRAVDALAGDLGRPPTVTEIAESVGVDEDEVLEALRAAAGYTAQPLPGERDDGDAPSERPIGRPDEGFDRAERRVIIGEGMRALAAREREIVRLRFFEDLSQAEIARRVGLSQMHVSRLLRSSLELMRKRIESGGTDDLDDLPLIAAR